MDWSHSPQQNRVRSENLREQRKSSEHWHRQLTAVPLPVRKAATMTTHSDPDLARYAMAFRLRGQVRKKSSRTFILAASSDLVLGAAAGSPASYKILWSSSTYGPRV